MNPFGYTIARPEAMARAIFTPLTRWERFRASCRDYWNEVILPAIMLAGAVTAFRLAIFFSFR